MPPLPGGIFLCNNGMENKMVHQYQLNGYNIVLDTCSGSVHVVDDVAYNCTEQYMMAEKARVFGDDDIRQKMLACNDPKEIKALGRQVKNFDAETWRRVSLDVVVKGNLHKFRQNPELCQFLLDTGEKILVEASPYDTIWGIGMQESEAGVDNPENWKGTNFLGFALMEVRGILSGHSI